MGGEEEIAVDAEEEEEIPGMRDVYEEAQTADDKEDEHLGAKDGKESGKKQSNFIFLMG